MRFLHLVPYWQKSSVVCVEVVGTAVCMVDVDVAIHGGAVDVDGHDASVNNDDRVVEAVVGGGDGVGRTVLRSKGLPL